MVEFIEDGISDNTVGIKINGRIGDDAFEAVTTVMEEKMLDHKKVNLYVELVDLGGIPPKTFLKDLGFSLRNIDRIGKEAIVTDKKWVKLLAPITDFVQNSIEVKTFSFTEKESAKTWVGV